MLKKYKISISLFLCIVLIIIFVKERISYNNLQFEMIYNSDEIFDDFDSEENGSEQYGSEQNSSKHNSDEEHAKYSTVINKLYSKSAVLIDGNSGRILLEKNCKEKMAMASTTKIMTCIIALEKCDLNKIMTVSKNAEVQPRVRMNVKENEKYYMKDLLYGLMLESYNDVAVVIAENIAGSVEKFAKMMNDKAKKLKMYNTNFVTPNGLDAEGHYSTAYDMALVGAYASKNSEFRQIVTTMNYSFSDVTGKRSVTVNNHDRFLSMDADAIGIKTGFTGKAGYCFVGGIESEDGMLISCVLGCGWPPNKTYKWHDTKILIEEGKDNFQYKRVLKNQKFKLKVINGTKDDIWVKADDVGNILVSNQDRVECKIVLGDKSNISEGGKVGTVQIYINNKKMNTINLLACENVEKFSFIYYLKHSILGD